MRSESETAQIPPASQRNLMQGKNPGLALKAEVIAVLLHRKYVLGPRLGQRQLFPPGHRKG